MKRLAWLILVLGLAAGVGPALSQEHEGADKKGAPKEESFAERHELELKWANFVILAGVLGYFIGKNAGPFFAARSAGIRKDMDESLRQSEEAKAKVADVDRRLANLEADLAALRAESEQETKVEAERVSRLTADEIAKIQAHAEQEIATAGKAARMELRQHAADLAVKLAEQKIRARISGDTQDALVQGFVRNLK